MSRLSNYIIMFGVLLLAARHNLLAQNTDKVVWKKTVVRVIDIPTSRNNKNAVNEPTLLHIMSEAIKNGKLTAYSNYDDNFTTVLSPQNFEKMVFGIDTIIVLDPITNQRKVTVTKWNFDDSSIHQYRILEEWAFNAYTGKTNIQITGIAPIRKVYGDDGAFRGVQAMFWVHYNDLSNALTKKYAADKIARHIWVDYLSNARTSGEIWKARVLHPIDISPKEDTVKHHLIDARQDTSMYELILSEIKAGQLAAYSNNDSNFAYKLPFEKLKEKLLIKTDTITVVDPTTNTEELKIASRSYIYSVINKFGLQEEWGFDPHTGKIDIQITGIAPMVDVNGNDGTPIDKKMLFCVRYNDLNSIMNSYEQYHPDNNIATHIWSDYFLSDIKPDVQK